MERKPLLPPAWLGLSLCAQLLLHFALPLGRWIAWPRSSVGLAPLFVGLALTLWCDALFRRHVTAIKPFEESSALVRSGPYRFSRNPIYFGMLLILVGVACLLGTVAPLAVVPAFAVLLTLRFIRVEEAMLEARFGDEHRAYARRVRRWI